MAEGPDEARVMLRSGDGETEGAEPGSPRPYAISEVPVGEHTEPVVEAPGVTPAPRGRETYPGDIPAAVIAAVLLASTFMPWYRGIDTTISGWASGTWGSIVACLAGLSILLIVLRRLGVSISLPFEESLIHEGVGWVSLAGAVVKSRFRPGGQGLFGIGYGVWVAIGAAVVLVILAGRMSPRAPLVLRPGWYRGRAGKVGVLLLLLVAGTAATFGATNSSDLTPGGPLRPGRLPGEVIGKLPECAKGFPIPAGVSPQRGFEGTCQVQLTSDKPAKDVAASFRSTLDGAGWKYTVAQQTEQSFVYSVTAPRCATLAIVEASGASIVAVVFTPCSSASPT